MKKATYDTNLTDAQWAYLQPLLPQPAKLGRPPTDRRRPTPIVKIARPGGDARDSSPIRSCWINCGR